MTHVDRLALVVVFALVGGLAIDLPIAHAQSAEAEVLFRDGRNLIKLGNLAAGCDKLAASEQLETSVGTLLNVGDCKEKLGKLASSWAAFRKAEAQAKRAGGDDKRQAEAHKRAAALEPQLVNLVIEVPYRMAGLVVRRDDLRVDAAAWGMLLPVDPGTYTIIAEAPGFLPWRRTIEIGRSPKRQVVVVPGLDRAPIARAPEPTIIRVASPTPATPLVTHRRGTWSATRKLSLGTAIVGAGAIGTGVYFGFRAKDLQDQADKRCPTGTCDDLEGLRLNDRAQSAAKTANIFYIAGGASVAATVVLWLIGSPSDEMVVTPAIGDRQLSVSLAGRF